MQGKNLFSINIHYYILIQATDKYRGTKQINVRQPAIVLLNPEDTGSLLAEPITNQQQKLAEYWKERAFIYIMGNLHITIFLQRLISSILFL